MRWLRPGKLKGRKVLGLFSLITIDIRLHCMTSKQIKALRETLALTQQKLADTIAATQVTVARWETDISRPTGAYLKALKDLAATVRNTAKTQKLKANKSTENITKTRSRMKQDNDRKRK
jgi:DNA-binding transcriptional regulator YiaG